MCVAGNGDGGCSTRKLYVPSGGGGHAGYRFGAPALSCRTSGVDSEGESAEPSTAAGSYRPTSNP